MVTYVALGAMVVLGVLYMLRRKSRLNSEFND